MTTRHFNFCISYANPNDTKRSEAFHCMDFDSYDEAEKNAIQRMRDIVGEQGTWNAGSYIISMYIPMWDEMHDIAVVRAGSDKNINILPINNH